MTLQEMAKLKRLTWAALERRAVEAGVPLGTIRAAATRDELRLRIIEASSTDAKVLP